MSADFLAGFISGLAGLLVGSPLDILKTNDQNASLHASCLSIRAPRTWFTGLPLPIVGLGLLNAILFWSYNLVLFMCRKASDNDRNPLYLSFFAGLFSGVCVCIVSVPTELVKVRAQTSSVSSWTVCKRVAKEEGILGFCRGGWMTIIRDSIGYGFYFLAYDGLVDRLSQSVGSTMGILLAGGFAGCISWFSIFPLDTVKTRMQALTMSEARLLLEDHSMVHEQGQGIVECMTMIYHESGIYGLYRGLPAAMVRAFLVNAVIFWIDDLIPKLLPHHP